MFYHAYDNYVHHAYPYDELKPITCKGFDTWGSFSLTLIDSLDMLIILGNRTEFERVVDLIVKNLNFNKDINVSVFETNIRAIGGLLSAHLLSYRLYLDKDSNVLDVDGKLDPGWPCDGPLLRMAIDVANKIIPAFNTSTGMPYGTINLERGVPIGETTETCVAGVGTFILEFATLSRLTGDPTYENIALRAMESIWNLRSSLNLIGNHINVQSGKWTGLDATIGSGVDSYFEYLVKGGILLNKPEFIKQFRTYQRAINRFLSHDNWFVWSNMDKGQKTLPLFSSLEAFYPGLLTLTGDLNQAIQVLNNYHKIWRKFGGLPEFFNIQTNNIHSNRENYPLRPELIESLMYIIRATNNDETYYEMAVDYLESIEHISRLKCGFATVKDVNDHRLENRMESFFLAETLKYLYLIFDKDSFLHNNLSPNSFKTIKNNLGECLIETGYFLFNTEAHPIDGASVECCRVLNKKKKNRDDDSDDGDDADDDVIRSLNLNKLVDRYVHLNNDNKEIHLHDYFEDDMDDNDDFKTMQQEYDELKKQLDLEEEEEQNRSKILCDKIVNSSTNKLFYLSEEYTCKDSFTFTCSLNDSFKLHASYLNNKNFFP